MVISHTRLPNIVAIDGRPQTECPALTFAFPSRALGAPLLVTLDLCEWRRVAQQIAEAAAALGVLNVT